MLGYKTIEGKSSAEIVEKKSRFIGETLPVFSEEEANQALEQIRKESRDANHHCWAFVIGDAPPLDRCSDDGEPSGTAGKPILEVIQGEGLRNVLIVVTRYFGGTLLGTGGLVRSYTKAAKAALENATVIQKRAGILLQVTTDYTDLGRIQYYLGEKKIPIQEVSYTDQVELKLMAAEEEKPFLIRDVAEITAGKAVLIEEGECLFAEMDGKRKAFER